MATNLTRLVVEVRMVFTCWGLIRRPNGGRMITKWQPDGNRMVPEWVLPYRNPIYGPDIKIHIWARYKFCIWAIYGPD